MDLDAIVDFNDDKDQNFIHLGLEFELIIAFSPL